MNSLSLVAVRSNLASEVRFYGSCLSVTGGGGGGSGSRGGMLACHPPRAGNGGKNCGIVGHLRMVGTLIEISSISHLRVWTRMERDCIASLLFLQLAMHSVCSC